MATKTRIRFFRSSRNLQLRSVLPILLVALFLVATASASEPVEINIAAGVMADVTGNLVYSECDPFKSADVHYGPDIVTITTTLDGTALESTPTYFAETGVQTGRLNRFAPPSECGSVKPSPGNFTTAGDRQFDQYRFVALTSGCVTVELRDAGDGVLFNIAYNEAGVNILDPQANHLADSGSSPLTGAPSIQGFDVVAGQIFHIVVHEVNAGGGIGQVYTLELTGVKLNPDFSAGGTMDATHPPPSPAYYGVTGEQTGRLTRDGIPSLCEMPKVNPGLWTPTGQRQVDLFGFIPAGSGCALVTLTHSGGHYFHAVVYDENGPVVADPSLNWVADSGASAVNQTRMFSLLVDVGIPRYFAVHEVEPGVGIGDEYTLNISNIPLISKISAHEALGGAAPSSGPWYSAAAGMQTGRLFRDGVSPSCEVPKPNPGLHTPVDLRSYDIYTFVPPVNGCVEVTLQAFGGTDDYLHHAAYNEAGFVPGDPSMNYLADGGSSSGLGTPQSFQMNVIGGQPFSVVVSAVDPGGGIGVRYELEVGSIVFWQASMPFFEDGFETGNTSAWSDVNP